jgi:CheY-like chemotaxis protein
MKVLFLDDDFIRIKQARSYFAFDEVYVAETSTQAMQLLEKHSPFNLVSLDHDLGGDTYCASDMMSGWGVAIYISRMPKDKLPKQVIIHSFNPDGAEEIIKVLRDIVPVVHLSWTLVYTPAEQERMGKEIIIHKKKPSDWEANITIHRFDNESLSHKILITTAEYPPDAGEFCAIERYSKLFKKEGMETFTVEDLFGNCEGNHFILNKRFDEIKSAGIDTIYFVKIWPVSQLS